MRWISAAALALITVSSRSWAQDVPPAPQSPDPAVASAPHAWRPAALKAETPATEESWYGWQMILVDLGTGGAGGPIVHAAHGNWGNFAGSLGLRAGLTVAGGMTGAAASHCEPHAEDFCPLGGVLIGAGLGFLAAVIIDYSVLAYETVPVTPPTSTRTAKLTVTPTVVADQKRVGLGFQGTF
jgi:hypothetical protein